MPLKTKTEKAGVGTSVFQGLRWGGVTQSFPSWESGVINRFRAGLDARPENECSAAV